MRIEVVDAQPRAHRSWTLVLPDGADVAAALAALPDPSVLAGIAGYAVYGVRVEVAAKLADGDRLELLRALQLDPKEARRRRAAKRDAG
ncbi:RnfH family protein [Luteimonas sp. S4-F44]|uniref:RnfH family protein n=1 Tax=Luteimonas sp. S4-F44 TaxID=2925842 RepID=UPI001F53155E|nr:RnfH family protein [Luteimonas sp. S4-F44]UNK43895.1 RnfH family protein [Luteimonas sp. S4-F44]